MYTDNLNFLVAASHLWLLSGEFLISPHAAAASQMESAVMKLAKEIRSRDQGYAQQGGEWFTKQSATLRGPGNLVANAGAPCTKSNCSSSRL